MNEIHGQIDRQRRKGEKERHGYAAKKRGHDFDSLSTETTFPLSLFPPCLSKRESQPKRHDNPDLD